MYDKVMNETKSPRKPFLAAFLTLLAPGMGQLYNAQVLKFLFFFATFNVIRLAYEQGAVSTYPGGYIALVLGILVLALWALIDAILDARRRQDFVLRGFNRWYIYLALLFLPTPLTIVAEEWKVADALGVPTRSMEPSIMARERIMIQVDHYDRYTPQRGDIALFFDENGTRLLKRIVGLGGETVELRGDQLFIDGELFQEPWPHQYSQGTLHWEPVQVPIGGLYVLGDNRDNSRDSRHFGAIGENQLGGRALYIAWSWNFARIGTSLLVETAEDP